MEGKITGGWYQHPKLGRIKIYENDKREWVYQCYSESGQRALSKEKNLDAWVWALCFPAPI